MVRAVSYTFSSLSDVLLPLPSHSAILLHYALEKHARRCIRYRWLYMKACGDDFRAEDLTSAGPITRSSLQQSNAHLDQNQSGHEQSIMDTTTSLQAMPSHLSEALQTKEQSFRLKPELQQGNDKMSSTGLEQEKPNNRKRKKASSRAKMTEMKRNEGNAKVRVARTKKRSKLG